MENSDIGLDVDVRDSDADPANFAEHRNSVATVESTHQMLPSRMQISHILKSNKNILEAAMCFNVPVTLLDKTGNAKQELPWTYLVEDFGESSFAADHHVKLLGPTALIELCATQTQLPTSGHPLYCLSMKNMAITFTGFQDKQYTKKLMHLVRAMGGSIRKDVSVNTTHLVANTSNSKRYELAAVFGIPIMSDEWVLRNWERRKIVGAFAFDDEMAMYRHQPFINKKVCFYGYETNEKEFMIKQLRNNGGDAVSLEDPECSFIVVNDMVVTSLPLLTHTKAKMVKSTWFWSSLEFKACVNADIHQFNENRPLRFSTKPSPQGSWNSVHQSSLNKQWLPDWFLAESTETVSSSSIDCASSSEGSEVVPGTPVSLLQLQLQAFQELLKTERNYVNVLKIIVAMKEEIENPDQPGGPLLNATEIKIIFEKLIPIHLVHSKMFQDLIEIDANWHNNSNIGQVISKYLPDMRAVYPSFVNFYEDSCRMLLECTENNVRFSSYLEKCRTHPSCGRQTLVELMIRPVQRLGSLMLLLKNVLKTYDDDESYQSTCLAQTINEIMSVISQVNEDKRKTEKLIKIFDVFHKINQCPANLVSSHRQLILHFEATELSDELSGRGDLLIFFLFTDVLEVARIRSRAKVGKISDGKSEEAGKYSSGKLYKHIALIPLAKIWRFVDIKDDEDYQQVFAFAYRTNIKEIYHSFSITSESMQKADLLTILCNQKATVGCKGNAQDHLLVTKRPSAVGITTSEISPVSLTKAVKNFAVRAKNSVSQVLHLSSPSKQCSTRINIDTLLSPSQPVVMPVQEAQSCIP